MYQNELVLFKSPISFSGSLKNVSASDILHILHIAKVHRDAMRVALVCAHKVASKLTMALDANDKMTEQFGTSGENHKPSLCTKPSQH